MAYDVIVVGSGPGGATAAATLAAQGKSVLMVDRQAFPRDKVCGDGLPANVMRLMKQLSIDTHAANCEYPRVKALSLSGPAAQPLPPHEEAEDVFSIFSRRFSFDNMLHQPALKSGAHFEQ